MTSWKGPAASFEFEKWGGGDGAWPGRALLPDGLAEDVLAPVPGESHFWVTIQPYFWIEILCVASTEKRIIAEHFGDRVG